MAIVVAALGVVVVLSLWWVYFDNIDESVVLRTYVAGQIWFYGHLPLMVAITAFGVGIERLIAADPGAAVPPLERWLVCGALVATLLTLALLHVAESDHKELTRLIGAAAVGALAIFGGGLSPAWLAAGLAAVATSLVLFDMRQHRSASPNEVGAGAGGHHD